MCTEPQIEPLCVYKGAKKTLVPIDKCPSSLALLNVSTSLSADPTPMYPSDGSDAFKNGNSDGINLVPILPTAVREPTYQRDAR